MTTEVKKTDGVQDPNSSDVTVKKKKKFKMPGAITILLAVVFVAIVITWIVHFITNGNYQEGAGTYSIHYWSLVSDDGIKYNWVQDGDWTGGMNYYISVYEKAYPAILTDGLGKPDSGWLGIVDGKWVMCDGLLEDNKLPDNATTIIDGQWFNFNHSDWYVSSNGMYGIFDSIMATIGGSMSAFSLILFTLAIGVMIEILMETEVLKSVVSGLIKGLGGKEIILVPVLFILFSTWGTVLGSQEATLAMMPIIVPALIIAGFDAGTGFLVILVGVTTGICASVLEPFALGTLAKEFDNVGSSYDVGAIGIGTGMVLRMVLFVAYTSIGAVFVTWYGNRVLKSKGEKSYETKEMQQNNLVWAEEHYGDLDLPAMNSKQKWSLGILGFTMAWMVFVLLPWANWFPALESSNVWISISHFFFFSSIVGEWNFLQLGFLFIVGWYIIAKMYGYNGSQMRTNWANAWKLFKGVAIILTLSRATSIVLTQSGSAYFLANNLFSTLSDMNAGLLSLCIFPIYVLMACLIPSMSGLAGISAPIIAPIAQGYLAGGDTASFMEAVIGIMAFYPLAQGLVNMTVPTTGLVVAQAEASQTDYGRSAKYLFGYAGVIALTGIVIISTALFSGMVG